MHALCEAHVQRTVHSHTVRSSFWDYPLNHPVVSRPTWPCSQYESLARLSQPLHRQTLPRRLWRFLSKLHLPPSSWHCCHKYLIRLGLRQASPIFNVIASVFGLLFSNSFVVCISFLLLDCTWTCLTTQLLLNQLL